MAADIGTYLMLAQFLLNQFQGRKDRAFRAPGAKSGRAHRNGLGQIRNIITCLLYTSDAADE